MKSFQTTLLTAILWLMTAISSAYANNRADFLPLAVGNSWTYLHRYGLIVECFPEEVSGLDMNELMSDPRNNIWMQEIDGQTYYYGSIDQEEMVTITVTHTEEIEGHTYFVFDMPDHKSPFLYYFLAGKKVRFEEGKLMEWEEGKDICLYDFSPELSGITSPEIISNAYPIPEHEGDTFVRRGPLHSDTGFTFEGHPGGIQHKGDEEARGASFQEGRGMTSCSNWVSPEDYVIKEHFLNLKATVLRPTSRHPTNWGSIKQSLSQE